MSGLRNGDADFEGEGFATPWMMCMVNVVLRSHEALRAPALTTAIGLWLWPTEARQNDEPENGAN